LGSGCTDTSTICLSYGTTATVQTSSPKYLETQRFFPAYPSALPNSYNTEVMIYRGFWMINWFKEEFGHPEVHRAQTQGTTPETFFEELIKRVPPGADGLILQPYWSPGLKNPGLEARGSILGFSGIHTRAHIYRAIIEGIAYALRKGVERTQHTTGNEASKIIISGGGSQSNEIMQLTADILGKTTYRPHTYETSSLGAAVNAAVGLGIYPNHKEAVKFMTRLKDSFHPIPSNTALYNAYYHRAYQHIYPRLYPIFKQIRLISQQFKA
ncbi:MAG: hypothetical protein RIS47_655, partial [Bacteroidota bacterium]